MIRRFLKAHAFFLVPTLLLVCTAASPSADKLHMQTAERCGADIGQPALKSFANFNGTDGWREYKTVKDIPNLELGTGTAAFYWAGSKGNFLILIQEPSEDWSVYTHYCFDRSGNLTGLRYEFRTAWGWGLRKEGIVEKGNFRAETSEFFDTTTEQPMQKPGMADEIPGALNPHLYLVKSTLPFSKLLPSEETPRNSRKGAI